MATSLRSIRAHQQYDMILVRFCRSWENKHFDTGDIMSYDYVLVDEEHETIHATIRSRDIEVVVPKIEVGQVYEIRRFFAANSRPKYNVVSHTAMLYLTRATTFELLRDDTISIPHHKFNFTDYDQLPAKVDNNNTLTDVIGVLESAQSLEKSFVNNKMISRKTIILQNIRNEKLQVTLWDVLAENFDRHMADITNNTVVTVFAAMSVKQYLGKPYVASTSATLYFFDLNIPETQTLKTRFANQRKKIELLPPSTKLPESLDTQRIKNRVKIEQIQKLDPNDRYTVRATIIDFDTTKGWWYNSCPICNKTARECGNTWWCDDHAFLQGLPVPWYKINTYIKDDTGRTMITIIGRAVQVLIKTPCSTLTIDQGFTDNFTFPPIIQQLLGQTKIFQFYFKIQSNNMRSIIVSRVFDDYIPAVTNVLPTSPVKALDPKTPVIQQNNIRNDKEATTSTTAKRKLLSSTTEESKKKL